MSRWRGLSLSICVGKSGGLFVSRTAHYLHVGLLWIGVTLWFLDLEGLITHLLKIDSRER